MVGQLIADRYELKDVVGTGGMSSVFCAYDTLLERNVALKLLHEHHSRDESYVERFRREARSVAQLSHPGIVTVIDRGEEDGRQFIVFEYVEGENLKEFIGRSGPLPIRRVLELGTQIASALAFAHAQQLVHRDVKPQNVLLPEEGPVKVTDFGIARSVDGIGTTETGTVLGTSQYIAPEQARGERVDAKTDVYSFGVVLYELLAGDVPFDGESFVAVALKHVNEPVPSVLERRPDCPARLANLVEHCLAKSPLDRPTMAEVVQELEATLAGLDALPDGDPTMITRAPQELRETGPRRLRARRRRWPLVALLAALVAAAVLAAVLLIGDGGDGASASGGSVVRVEAVASYDPEGDRTEHDDRLSLATDGNPSTYWTTEGYGDFAATKDGVGIVVESPKPLDSLTVTTDLPGWTAEIKASDSTEEFSQVVGESKTTEDSTTWSLEKTNARYYLIWITKVADDGSGKQRAHVNEVTARA